MSSEIFFPLGILLVIAALGLAFIGLRNEGFPGSKRTMAAVAAGMALLVVCTLTAAIVLAEDEQQERDEEIAAELEEAEQVEPEAAADSDITTTTTTEATTTSATEPVLELSSPADGSLTFDPGELEAAAGTVVLDYTNPSPVPHNIALEDSDGNSLGETETVTGGEIAELSSDLQPGTYTYFCAVPGHRESGMLGELTVD